MGNGTCLLGTFPSSRANTLGTIRVTKYGYRMSGTAVVCLEIRWSWAAGGSKSYGLPQAARAGLPQAARAGLAPYVVNRWQSLGEQGSIGVGALGHLSHRLVCGPWATQRAVSQCSHKASETRATESTARRSRKSKCAAKPPKASAARAQRGPQQEQAKSSERKEYPAMLRVCIRCKT